MTNIILSWSRFLKTQLRSLIVEVLNLGERADRTFKRIKLHMSILLVWAQHRGWYQCEHHAVLRWVGHCVRPVLREGRGQQDSMSIRPLFKCCMVALAPLPIHPLNCGTFAALPDYAFLFLLFFPFPQRSKSQTTRQWEGSMWSGI